ncbi:2-keto-4-pentenoate hydratase [Rhodalgimonas zhirmunskyi]|uniref:Fumarylacetoacetase-like C-terminal domain-containing protein n=1 Tax=Rhodalgimonas zhirmunskyi TaxID=2964767 RepID=A0AAJ1X3W1_9RHOB|nr:fumarylacetoacetate hydrolase family protein [Rhodoalgimonas zhirmunskyi]MDQ2093698.1 hypothetical protein [Rhodoalgimonas zhirmunskyi]
MTPQEMGATLAEARRDGRKLSDYPGPKPTDMDAAQAVQDAMTAAMGLPVLGWKVGLTAKKAQEICGVDAPLAGPVFEIAESGVEWPLLEGDLGVIEAEIGFRMRADLPPRDAEYARAEVLAAVGTVLPVFEWVNKRLPGGLREAAEWLLADGVVHRGLIAGAERAYAPDMDMAAETVRVSVNGTEATRGAGAAALGDPAEVLVWLANALNRQGKGLCAGQVIATGLICDVVEAVPGAEIVAEYATLGRNRLSIKGL